MEWISAAELCAASGATYRQVDYWARTGVLVPAIGARGSGTHRRYRWEQALTARLLFQLTSLGATHDVLRPVSDSVAAWPSEWWAGYALVTADGEIFRGRHDTDIPAAYIVNLSRCADRLPVAVG